MDYRPRSFRIDDEVYEAIQRLPVSLNRYLREKLLGQGFTPQVTLKAGSRVDVQPLVVPRSRLDAVGPKLSDGMGKATTSRWQGPLLRPGDRK